MGAFTLLDIQSFHATVVRLESSFTKQMIISKANILELANALCFQMRSGRAHVYKEK